MMHQSIVLFIALRYVRSKTIHQFYKYVNWISNVAIMLSVTAIIMILSMTNGFEHELRKNISYFIPHAIVTANKGYSHIQNIPNFLSKYISKDILYIKPLVISDVILQSSNKISFGIMLGIDPKHFEPLFNYLVRNDNFVQLMPDKYYVIIGSKLAQQLSVNINDQIRLTIPSVNQIALGNSFFSQRLFTVLDIYTTNNEIDNYQILVHQADAAKLMHYPPCCVTGWRIWLREPFKLHKFSQLNISDDYWHWKDWSKSKGSLFQAIKMEKNVMFALFILIIIVVGFNVIAFLILLITDKKKEIAILKTYGLNRFQVMILFMIQGTYNSIIGIICGTILGIFLSKNLNQILYLLNVYPKPLLIPIEIQYFQILTINFIVCLIVILNILYPAWYISSIRPAQVLHHD